MELSPHKKDFKPPGWFRKLWNGKLFGSRKDKLILKIIKLGGRELLMSRSGLQLHFDRDTIDVAPAPSMKLLFEVLREAESERREVEESSAKAEVAMAQILARPEDYNVQRAIIPSRTGPPCETAMWTPKQPAAKRRK